jgi:hypothetical protein
VQEKATPVSPQLNKKNQKEEPREESKTLAADLFPDGKKERGHPSKERPQKKAQADPAESFERFWASYPRKVAKEAARKAFAKAVEGKDESNFASILIAGAQRYAAERAGKDPTYTKHPATWLNAGCWQDEMPAGAVIDQSGAIVAIEQPPPQREDESYGVYERAEEIREMLAAAAGPNSWWAGGKS